MWPFTVTATDFNPRTVKVTQPLTSIVTVTPQIGFAGTVTLSCGGTSGGIAPQACGFDPPNVALSSGAATSTLTVMTSGGIAGSGHVEIRASGGGVSKSYSLPFTLTDYTLSNVSQPNNASSGGMVNFSFTLTGSPGFSGSVIFSCDAVLAVPVTCAFNPGSPVALTANSSRSIDVSVVIPSNEPGGNYTIRLNTRDLEHNLSTAPDLSSG
jgi:hypothetical protein